LLKKLLIGAALLLACGLSTLGQGFRMGDSFPITSSLTTPGQISTVSGSVINICTFPANAVPCTNKATTYTSVTLGTPCSTSTQIVLAGTNSCVGTTDPRGNWGAWVAAGNYDFTITVGTGQSFGPFSVNVGIPPGSNISPGTITASGLITANAGITSAGPNTFNGVTNINGTMTVSGAATFSAGITTNSLTDSGLTTGNCVQASTAGLLTTVSGPCGTSSGTITATGAPAAGNVTCFSGATSVTNCNLSGDATTSGTSAVTVVKVNGTSIPSSPSTNQVAIVTAANTATYKTLPACVDTGGQHLNWDNSAFAFICGVSTANNTNFGRQTTVCSTTNAGGSTCTTTINLNFTEPDTNYSAAIGCVGPSQYPIILGYTKTTSSVTVTISNGTGNMAQVSTCAELDVVVTGT
jgi:hypothetical protein